MIMRGGLKGISKMNQKDKTRDWVPFGEGEYLVDRACLIAPDESAVLLEKGLINVFMGPGGIRHALGRLRDACHQQLA